MLRVTVDIDHMEYAEDPAAWTGIHDKHRCDVLMRIILPETFSYLRNRREEQLFPDMQEFKTTFNLLSKKKKRSTNENKEKDAYQKAEKVNKKKEYINQKYQLRKKKQFIPPIIWLMAAYLNLQQHFDYIKKKSEVMSDNFCNGANCSEGSEYSKVFVGNEYHQQLQRQKRALPLIPIAFGITSTVAAANIISSAATENAP